MADLTQDEAEDLVCDMVLAMISGDDLRAGNIVAAGLLRNPILTIGALIGIVGALTEELAKRMGVPVEQLIEGMRP